MVRKMKRTGILWVYMVVYSAWAGSPPVPPSELATVQTLNRENSTEPETLDPARAVGVPEVNVLLDLYEGLLGEAPDGHLVPGVATRWDISTDGLTYTFYLRKNAKWSNGDPVVADDFVAGVRRVVDPKVTSPYGHLLADIRNALSIIKGQMPVESLGIEALDPNTVVFHLAQRAPYFLQLLTHPTLYPIYRPAIKKYGDQFTRPGRLVSNGPFFLKAWEVHSHIQLEKNPHYWDHEKTYLNQVNFLPLESRSVMLDRYRAGEVDLTMGIPEPQIQWINENLKAELHVGPYGASCFYGINLRHGLFKNAPQLRRALILAINRDILTQKVLGLKQAPAYKLVPNDMQNGEPWVPEWANWTQERKEEEARKLYREAGYSRESPLKLDFLYNTEEGHKRIAIAIAAMWKKVLGVQVELINEEWKVFLADRRLGKFSLFRAAWVADYNDPMAFLYLFKSDNQQLPIFYKNPQFDQLLFEANALQDLKKRAQLLAQAERLLMEACPIVPLYYYVAPHLVKPYVGGFHENLMDRIQSKYLYIKKERDLRVY